MPGPPRKPTALGILEGSRRSIARAGKEPTPDKSAPPCPKWLTKEAKAAWRQAVKHLGDMGTLAVCDGNALARYCTLLVDWLKAQEFIDKHGMTYPIKNDEGKVKCFQQFPQVGIRNKLTVDLGKLEQQFGLTPASRASIEVDVSQDAPKARVRDRGAG